MFICSIAAEPYVPVPGANVFIATQDLTSAPDSEGNRLIHCQPISDTHAATLAAKGVNLLRRIVAGVPAL